MRRTVITIATTALVTAIVATWGTSVIIAHTQKTSDDAMAPVDIVRLIQGASTRADENAAPVD